MSENKEKPFYDVRALEGYAENLALLVEDAERLEIQSGIHPGTIVKTLTFARKDLKLQARIEIGPKGAVLKDVLDRITNGFVIRRSGPTLKVRKAFEAAHPCPPVQDGRWTSWMHVVDGTLNEDLIAVCPKLRVLAESMIKEAIAFFEGDIITEHNRQVHLYTNLAPALQVAVTAGVSLVQILKLATYIHERGPKNPPSIHEMRVAMGEKV